MNVGWIKGNSYLMQRICFHCEDDDVLEQVTQRGCGISSQENSKHSHKGVALSNVQSQKWI